MTIKTKFRNFYTNWLNAFEAVKPLKRPAPGKHDMWEGVEAYDEIEPTGAMIILVPLWETLDQPVTTHLEQIWTEVQTYQRLAGQIASQNSQFRDVLDFFDSTEKRRKKIENRISVTRLKSAMTPLKRRLTEDRQRIEKIYKSYWKRALRDYEYTRSGFVEHIAETDEYLDAEPDPPPPHIASLKEIQSESKDEERLKRDMDLDGRFQRRLGRLLRHWLPQGTNIRMRTISRLIALIYLSAGLAEEREIEEKNKDGTSKGKTPKLIILQTGRPLSLDGIDQILDDIGLK